MCFDIARVNCLLYQVCLLPSIRQLFIHHGSWTWGPSFIKLAVQEPNQLTSLKRQFTALGHVQFFLMISAKSGKRGAQGSVGQFPRFLSLWPGRHRVGQISGMIWNSYQCKFASCFCLWLVEPILLVVLFCWLGPCLWAGSSVSPGQSYCCMKVGGLHFSMVLWSMLPGVFWGGSSLQILLFSRCKPLFFWLWRHQCWGSAVLLVRALSEGRIFCITWAKWLLHESWGPPFFHGPLIHAARSFLGREFPSDLVIFLM